MRTIIQITKTRRGLVGAVFFLAALSLAAAAWACPFCSAVSLTFSEEIGASAVAVFARLIEPPPKSDKPVNDPANPPRAKFEVVEVVKGIEAVGKLKNLETVYFGDKPVGTMFLIMGIEPPNVSWSTPIEVNDRVRKYISQALGLPKEGVERLAFFQEYLENPDEILARDAYDEFAKAPFAAVKELKEKMHRDRLVEWIKNPQVHASRRRLYLTMLGVCGQAADATMLEEMIRSKDPAAKTALDALVAAYLTLKGPDGMPLVEELFLQNKEAEYTDTYATIMALRFHGQEETIVPRARLLQGLRLMLDKPQLADLVIPDLARWEDWSVVDRLTEMFKQADDQSSWIRVPVINYLRACPLPKAAEHLAELSKSHPEVVKQANAFFPFGAAGGGKPAAGKGASAGGTAPATAAPNAAAPAGTATPGGTAAPSGPAQGSSAPAGKEDKSAEKPSPPKPADAEQKSAALSAAHGMTAARAMLTTPGGQSLTRTARRAEESPVGTASTALVTGGLATACVVLAAIFWGILGPTRAAGRPGEETSL